MRPGINAKHDPTITCTEGALMIDPFLAQNPKRSARSAVRAVVMRLCCVALLTIIAVLSANGHPRPDGPEPVAQPSIPAILASFDKHDNVGVPPAHTLTHLHH